MKRFEFKEIAQDLPTQDIVDVLMMKAVLFAAEGHNMGYLDEGRPTITLSVKEMIDLLTDVINGVLNRTSEGK